MNLAVLKAELLAGHPVTGAYNVDHALAADQINLVNRELNINELTGDQVFRATDAVEFAAMTEHRQNIWVSWTSKGSIDPWDAVNVEFVQWVFGAGSDTVSNLQGLRKTPVSRAEELGLGVVFASQVERARAYHA